MKLKITHLKSGVFAIAFLTSLASIRADYTDNLLVGWTFNSGSLTSDLGSISAPVTFSELGYSGTPANNTLSYDSTAGTISIGPGKELYATAINSTTHPELLSAVTIWVRVRFDGPLLNTGIFGLLNESTPKTGSDGFNNYSAAMQIGNPANREIAFTGRTDTGASFNRGSGHPTLPASGYVNLAFRVQDLGTNSSLFAEYLNGTSHGNTWGAGGADLQSFAAFAIGRIKGDAGIALSIDEIRIYSAFLTNEQLDQISVTPIPESGTTAALVGLATLVCAAAFVSRRRLH